MAECIKVYTSLFFNRIAIEPAAVGGEVVAELIGEHACFAVVILGAEAKIEETGITAVLLDHVAVGIVDVLRGGEFAAAVGLPQPQSTP